MQLNQNNSTQEGINRKGCLLLLAAGFIFIAATSYLLYYMGTSSKDEATQENFRAAIIKCRQKAQETGFKLDQDDCEKSARKFERKFGQKP